MFRLPVQQLQRHHVLKIRAGTRRVYSSRTRTCDLENPSARDIFIKGRAKYLQRLSAYQSVAHRLGINYLCTYYYCIIQRHEDGREHEPAEMHISTRTPPSTLELHILRARRMYCSMPESLSMPEVFSGVPAPALVIGIYGISTLSPL